MRVVIVGGVAAGMSAATRLRRLDEHAEIIVLERGAYVSFANCGLPYHLSGVIAERDALLLQTPESLAARFGIEVRVLTEAVAIDRAASAVRVRDVATGDESTLTYDRLVLATGALGLEPFAGAGIPVRELRTIDDMDAIIRVLDAAPAGAPVVVVGAGFIGLEAVENLVARGQRVTLVTRGDRPFSRLDLALSEKVSDALERHGVELVLHDTVAEVMASGVALSSGREVAAALVVDARGIRPASELAQAAGLRVAASGAVVTDAAHRTSDERIFAVGDVAEKRGALDGAAVLVPLAGPANRAGREVADVIAGRAAAASPVLGTAILQVFNRTVGTVGWSEADAVRAGRRVRMVRTHPAHHAGYYPGAEQMSIVLVVDADSDAILGAQIVGGAGVDRRIDVLAMAMSVGFTASRLASVELAYAPQFGSAKDPVNLLGMVAENRANGLAEAIEWHEVAARQEAGAVIVDVRSAAEHAAGSIAGAVLIAVDELRGRVGELAGREVIVHCQVGQRGHVAQRMLAQHGIRSWNLDGGWLTWDAGMRARARTAEGVRV